MTATRGWACAFACVLAVACANEHPVRIGTTFTLQQSGALDLLDSLQDSSPVQFVVVVGPSGQIVRSAAAGNFDVVVAHAPALEQRWLTGHWTRRCAFVSSHFAVVGPASDPARVATARSAPDALRRIARTGAMFVSRGDSSGTHQKERALWKSAGLDPAPSDTYFETGADQATTLRLSDEWGAYALADLPTLARQAGLKLAVLFDRDSLLANAYTMYVMRADTTTTHRGDALADWLLSAWRQRLKALRLPDSTPGFSFGVAGCESP